MARPSARQLIGPGVVTLVSFAAFFVLAASVHMHALATSVDPEVAADVLGLRSPWLTLVARALTLVGGEAVVGVVALLLLIAVLERRGLRCAGVVLVTLATSAALTVTVKLLLGRARPGVIDRLGPVDQSYSFPSGHTLNSAVLLGLVCLTLVPLVPNRLARRMIVLGCLVLAVGIGASRVYLGYHWTTDVLASWCIAAVLLSLAHSFMAMVGTSGPQSGASQVRGHRINA